MNWTSEDSAKFRDYLQKNGFKFRSYLQSIIPTCDGKTIEEVATFLNIPKSQTIKAVIKKAIYEDKTQIVVFFVIL